MNALGNKAITTDPICEVCGGTTSVPAKAPWRTLRCLTCGLVFVPNPDIPPDLYEEDYTRAGNVATYRFDGTQYRMRAPKIWGQLLDDLERYRLRGTLLDVGCGLGFFLEQANKRGWETYGLEVSKFASQYARDTFNLRIHRGTLDDNPYAANYFDVVVCSHVLKHLLSPKTALEQIYRVLRPGGVVVVLLPTPFSSLSYKLFGVVHGPAPPIHLYFFSPRNLTLLLRRTGFRVVKKELNTQLMMALRHCVRSIGVSERLEKASDDYENIASHQSGRRIWETGIRMIKKVVNLVGWFVGFSDEIIVVAQKRPR